MTKFAPEMFGTKLERDCIDWKKLPNHLTSFHTTQNWTLVEFWLGDIVIFHDSNTNDPKPKNKVITFACFLSSIDIMVQILQTIQSFALSPLMYCDLIWNAKLDLMISGNGNVSRSWRVPLPRQLPFSLTLECAPFSCHQLYCTRRAVETKNYRKWYSDSHSE